MIKKIRFLVFVSFACIFFTTAAVAVAVEDYGNPKPPKVGAISVSPDYDPGDLTRLVRSIEPQVLAVIRAADVNDVPEMKAVWKTFKNLATGWSRILDIHDLFESALNEKNIIKVATMSLREIREYKTELEWKFSYHKKLLDLTEAFIIHPSKPHASGCIPHVICLDSRSIRVQIEKIKKKTQELKGILK